MGMESPHPQLQPIPDAWYLVVPDGPCFDGGPDFLVGPYADEDDAWAGHDRLTPPPCRAHLETPVHGPYRAAEGGAHYCDCVALPLMTPAAPQ